MGRKQFYLVKRQDRLTRCQWRSKIAHFLRIKTAHSAPIGREPYDALASFAFLGDRLWEDPSEVS